MNLQHNIDFSRVITDEAIMRVEKNTNAKHDGWTEDCLRYFKIWLENRKELFQSEDFRNYVKGLLPAPTSDRVYGSIMRRANKLGWIEYIKTEPVKTPSNHQARASVWRSLLRR